MSNIYGATALTGGGTKALDGSTYYDGDDLVDGDGAVVITPSSVYAFHLDAASGAAENSPLVISPDANAGTKRWLLKSGVFAGLTSYGNVLFAAVNGGLNIGYSVAGTAGGERIALNWMTKDGDGDGAFDAGDKGWQVTARGDAFSTPVADQNKMIFYRVDNQVYNPVLTLDFSGKVGFGTTTPNELVELKDGNLSLSDSDVVHGITSWIATDGILLISPDSAVNGGARVWGFSDDAGQRGLAVLGIIGVADPTDTTPALVLGGARKSGTSLIGLSASETLIQFDNWGSVLFTMLGNGNAGFGTVNPSELLHLESSISSNILIKTVGDAPVFFKGNSNRVSSNAGLFVIDGHWNGTIVARINMISGADNANKDDGYIAFSVAEGGTLSEAMRIEQDSGILMYSLKSGANQGAAGAAANELWRDTADNSIKIGV